ncbi:uncharacterized protein ARMOST_04500 [Armillaria ostoyae]|uniref:Uncharacterized protein n=1 Tax=Armillaria ostoyae TaxID=47428 RepID=A0A284QXR3_ARMOS|nr:uncharacterized protein ARMOST_04500 [Armillaria ostoyae]
MSRNIIQYLPLPFLLPGAVGMSDASFISLESDTQSVIGNPGGVANDSSSVRDYSKLVQGGERLAVETVAKLEVHRS